MPALALETSDSTPSEGWQVIKLSIRLLGFGNAARSDLKRAATALLPLRPEGDIGSSLNLLLRYELGDEGRLVKIHARANAHPQVWPAPALAVMLADDAEWAARTAMLHSLNRLDEKALCVILCRSDEDRDTLYANLAPAVSARIAAFTVVSPESSAGACLAWSLVQTLRESFLCVDLSALIAAMPGKGAAYWRNEPGYRLDGGEQDRKRLITRSEELDGLVYGRITAAGVEQDQYFKDAQADMGEWFEADMCIVLSYISGARFPWAQGVFAFATQAPCAKLAPTPSLRQV